MANTDKNIVITPNRGSSSDQPKIVFTGQNNVPVTLKITDTGNLTWESSTTQLLSINNSSTSVPEIVTYGPITGYVAPTPMDLYGLTDSNNCVFILRQNQTALSITDIKDSKDVEVTVDGEQYSAYASQRAYAFMPIYEVDSRTFRVRENRLIIYNAPDTGAKISVVVRKSSTAPYIRRYPFSAATIGFGD